MNQIAILSLFYAKKTIRCHYRDEELQTPQALPKRARIEDKVAPTPGTRANSRGNGKGKVRAVTVDSDNGQDEDVEESVEMSLHIEDEIDGEENDRLYEDKVKASLENKRRNQIAGFICHPYLKFTFGPQINFIIGHNGSGKSAVLSAITVALGDISISTGRGNGLKSFIREGQLAAEVTIHIKNQGEEAYKPEEYGKTIVITRNFQKDGSSSWKIKSKDGKVISTRRDELSAICNHMNIQVDNPMDVLTQDSARKFLGASAPQEKYKLFMRGTLLLQLHEEYELCMENIRQVSRLLMVKKDALPDLWTRLNQAKARYNEAAKAQEQKEKVDDLKKELAWSYVSAKEAELERMMEEVAKLTRRLPRIEENIRAAKACALLSSSAEIVASDAADEQVVMFKNELNNLQSIEDLNAKKADLQEQMRNCKTELLKLNGKIGLINQSVAIFNDQIAELEEEMREEAYHVASGTQGKHEEAQHKLEDARLVITQLEHSISELMMHRKDKDIVASEIKVKETIFMAKQKERDALVPYGNDIKTVLEKIKAASWHGDVRLGLLSRYVTAKDPRVWDELLRNQLWRLLVAFAITDARDRPQLKRILQSCSNQRVTILVYQKDVFDYHSGEPPENYLTALPGLHITDQHITRILINHLHIESRILTYKRQEAAEILRSIGEGSAWSLDRMSIQNFPQLIEEKRQAEKHFSELSEQLDKLKTQFFDLKKEIDNLNDREHCLHSQLREEKTKLIILQLQAKEELPAGLAGIQAAKEDAEAKRKSHMEQFTELAKKKAKADEAQKVLQDQLNEIRALMDKHQKKRDVIGISSCCDLLDDLTSIFCIHRKSSRMRPSCGSQLKNKQKHYEAKYAAEKREVNKAENEAQALQVELTSWHDKALQYCEEVSNPRKTDEVQRQLDSTQKALERQENAHGASVEEMAYEVNKARENL
ncbi:hypothetical protein CPB84DRAFT_1842078 [Gymnopilus junonius]|uniref:Rad50/SbcC-type AAA domain-containing protein n=1 Tax=Gymnopilus junonius TaxID=109634 RepID=A0A9P5NZA7_GYMJU|nr:hypothetical protein CPB84DRAFT_1842078 [Gymnopilus junonius]